MFKKMMMLIAVLLISTIANATSFTNIVEFSATTCDGYIDHGWGDVNEISNTLDYVVWEHLFDTSTIGTITSASLTMNISDDEDYNILDPTTWEIALILGEDRTIDERWTISTDDYNYEINCDYLNDGIFKVAIGSLLGDFTINSSILTIEDDVSAAAPVPEPATMLLMGTGLICMVAGKKKFMKK